MNREAEAYPDAIEPGMVGEYSALAKAGGGYVWDEVLEYRVWCHPEDGGDDYYYAFATFAEALKFAECDREADDLCVLILQREWLDEPEPGVYEHKKGERIAEWQPQWLSRPRRTDRTIPDFLSPDAPPNRLDIIRGMVGKA